MLLMNQSCHKYEWVESQTAHKVLWSCCAPRRAARGIPGYTKESWHTYEWVMSHVWMSHVAHMNGSWHTYEAARSIPGYTKESCHTYELVMAHIWMGHGTHITESCRKYEWVRSVTHASESCHTYERVTCCTRHSCTNIDIVCQIRAFYIYMCSQWSVSQNVTSMQCVPNVFFIVWRKICFLLSVSQIFFATHFIKYTQNTHAEHRFVSYFVLIAYSSWIFLLPLDSWSFHLQQKGKNIQESICNKRFLTHSLGRPHVIFGYILNSASIYTYIYTHIYVLMYICIYTCIYI